MYIEWRHWSLSICIGACMYVCVSVSVCECVVCTYYSNPARVELFDGKDHHMFMHHSIEVQPVIRDISSLLMYSFLYIISCTMKNKVICCNYVFNALNWRSIFATTLSLSHTRSYARSTTFMRNFSRHHKRQIYYICKWAFITNA